MCEFTFTICSSVGTRELFQFKAADGELFSIKYTGCNEAIVFYDSNHNYVTAISRLDHKARKAITRKELLEEACAAITAIKATKYLKNSKERLARLRIDVEARMKEKGIVGEVLVNAIQ